MPRTTHDVIDVLNCLPPERVEEVYDFALFLKARCQPQLDQSDEWSEEDVRDATEASLLCAEQH